MTTTPVRRTSRALTADGQIVEIVLPGPEATLGPFILVVRAFADHLGPDLSAAAGTAFAALARQEGQAMKVYCAEAGLTKAACSRAFRTLEERGAVRLVRNKDNRREVLVFLTAKGRRLRDALLSASMRGVIASREAVVVAAHPK